MFQQTPIFSDVAKPLFYPVLTAGNSNRININAAFGSAFGYVTLNPSSYFVFTGLRVTTNYDNAGGTFGVEGNPSRILAAPPFVPNNFSVAIARGQSSTYSTQPMTQAEICSSGYLAGKQLPLPVIYGPRFSFSFTFTDKTGLFLLDAGDAAVPLSISMAMAGFNVPKERWPMFLNYFPALKNVFPT